MGSGFRVLQGLRVEGLGFYKNPGFRVLQGFRV